MESWGILLDILILLGTALALGTLAEQLKQNAIVGYLLAGMLVGPNMLGLVSSAEGVDVISELGVALLLFSIGLEFSFRRLVSLGPITFVGGTVQVLVTGIVGYVVAAAAGLSTSAATVVGGMVALSSTACVLRLLVTQTQMDSQHGRNCIGILLLQDIAVVPLVLLTTALSGEGGFTQVFWMLAKTVVLGAAVFVVLYGILNYLIPRLLNLETWSKNRELPILLAIVVAIGSAFAAHKAGLSPSFGAFLSGLLLAESPFAVQIRADIGSLRAVLVTLFFASIGMLGHPLWVVTHGTAVGVAVILIVLGKTIIIWAIVRALGFSNGVSLATGVCLAQVGEFSFVLAQVGSAGGLLDQETFLLLISATVVSLFLTPYLTKLGPLLAHRVRTDGGSTQSTILSAESLSHEERAPQTRPVVIIGFGPSGRCVAESLSQDQFTRLVVLDSNPRNAGIAGEYGVEFHVGDARNTEVLEHLPIQNAAVIVVTVPDPGTSGLITRLCRSLAPHAKVLARARYHLFYWDLQRAGADAVVDEEKQVGLELARQARQTLLGEFTKDSDG